MNPNCNRDPLTCRCRYHQGHVDEPPSSQAVVSQDLVPVVKNVAGFVDAIWDGRTNSDMTVQHIHHGSDGFRPSPVSGDGDALVEQIAGAVSTVIHGVDYDAFQNPEAWEHFIDIGRAILPIIEAAQIAAVKAALAYVEELAHDHRVIEACLIQAINPADIIRALRTPSQHQESEG